MTQKYILLCTMIIRIEDGSLSYVLQINNYKSIRVVKKNTVILADDVESEKYIARLQRILLNISNRNLIF